MSVANPYFHADNKDAAEQMRLRRWAAVASLSVAGILIITKFAAYIKTDSVSIMTSLLDSTFDAIASTVTLVSVVHAASPADEDHRWGHGKIEALAAMGQALFIFGSAGFLLFEAFHRFVTPQPVKDTAIGIGVMLLSVILTIGLVAFQRHVVNKTQSVAISADRLHYSGDLLTNIAVIAALLLTSFSPWPYFDPLFAATISLVLLYGAKRICMDSIAILMDAELTDEERQKIMEIVTAHAKVQSVHDLRTRHSGDKIFIEFHMEVDGGLTLTQAHDITEEIEMLLYKEFPKSEVLIHPEPAGLDDHRLDHRISAN